MGPRTGEDSPSPTLEDSPSPTLADPAGHPTAQSAVISPQPQAGTADVSSGGGSFWSAHVSDTSLAFTNWLYRSKLSSVIWLGARLWLGYSWANAGYQKIWGNERASFWFGGGSGVKGFATAGIAGSVAGKGGASYGWWAAFLRSFVLPNVSWIAKLISAGELLIGIALLVGLLTGLAAFAGLALNFIYMLSGSAGVNPMYAIFGILLVLAWRNAGWIGLDRFVLPGNWTNLGSRTSRQRSSANSGVQLTTVS